jgi:transposase-like protein
MGCPHRKSSAATERPERAEVGDQRFRCHTCEGGFNERTGTLFNRLQDPTDVVF